MLIKVITFHDPHHFSEILSSFALIKAEVLIVLQYLNILIFQQIVRNMHETMHILHYPQPLNLILI